MIVKGLLILLGVFCTLVTLLAFAKYRPAPDQGAGLVVVTHHIT